MTTKHDLRQARYERACWWLERGVELVPLKPFSKHLQPGYGSRKAHITTVDFARQWFLNTDANLGVVLGDAAGLAVMDWDNAKAYELWRGSIGATVETLTEQTARGCHAFFLGFHLPPAEEDGAEFKTGGVCMVAPSVHPTGIVYRVSINAALMPLTEEEAHILFPFLSEKMATSRCWRLDDSAVRKERNGGACGTGIVARIKAMRSVEDEISASGVQLRPAGQDELVGLCPFNHDGHSDHRPSLWVNIRRQRWGCYAPGCESNVGHERAHDVVNYRAMSRGISEREAIKQMVVDLFPPT